MLKIGLPWGSMWKKVEEMFRLAEMPIVKETSNERDFRIKIQNNFLQKAEISRPQIIPKEVETGFFDLGISTREWVLEQQVELIELMRFDFSRNGNKAPRVALISSKNDVGKELRRNSRVATELPNLAKKYFYQIGRRDIKIIFSWGATEAMIPHRADYIIDLVDSGETLAANNLEIMQIILEAYPVLIANKAAWKNVSKQKAVEELKNRLSQVSLKNGIK